MIVTALAVGRTPDEIGIAGTSAGTGTGTARTAIATAGTGIAMGTIETAIVRTGIARTGIARIGIERTGIAGIRGTGSDRAPTVTDPASASRSASCRADTGTSDSMAATTGTTGAPTTIDMAAGTA